MLYTPLNDPRLVVACKKYRLRELHFFGSAVLQDLVKSNDIGLLATSERDGFEGAFEQFMGFKETV